MRSANKDVNHSCTASASDADQIEQATYTYQAKTQTIMEDYLTDLRHKLNHLEVIAGEFEDLNDRHFPALNATSKSEPAKETEPRTTVQELHSGLACLDKIIGSLDIQMNRYREL